MYDPIKDLDLGGGSRFLVGLSAVIALLVGGQALYERTSFIVRAHVVDGRVTGITPGIDLSDIQHGRHSYQVSYPGENGPFHHGIKVSRRYKIGSPIRIAYLPSNPYAVRVANFREMWLFPVLMLSLASFLGVCLTWPLWRWVVRPEAAGEFGGPGRHRRAKRAPPVPEPEFAPEFEPESGPEPHRFVPTPRQSKTDPGPEFTFDSFETTEEIFPCPGCGREVVVKDHARTPCAGCGAVWTGIPAAYSKAVEEALEEAATAAVPPPAPVRSESHDEGSTPVYDPERAARFVWDRLRTGPDRLSIDDVLRILDLEAEYQESIGLTGDTPADESDAPVLDVAQMTTWIRYRAARSGTRLHDSMIEAVLDAELAYLESIGAV